MRALQILRSCCYTPYNILSTVPFKAVPSTGDTPFSTFLPLFECFLERTFCDGAQFSYRIFLNLRVFKKRPNFLNSSPTNTDDVLRLLSAPSDRFWQQTIICPVSLWALVIELHPLNWARAQAVLRINPTIPALLASWLQTKRHTPVPSVHLTNSWWWAEELPETCRG